MLKKIFIFTGLVGLLAGVCIIGLVTAGRSSASSAAVEADRIDLRILFVGKPGSARQKDFTGFLKQHFKGVRTADLANFAPETSEGFDVTIFDYDGDGFKAPRVQLPEDFNRPVVTISVAGALMSDNWRLKTGYL